MDAGALAQYDRASRLVAGGRFAEALAILERLAASHPSRPELLFALGSVHLKLGNVRQSWVIAGEMESRFSDQRSKAFVSKLKEELTTTVVAVPPAIETIEKTCREHGRSQQYAACHFCRGRRPGHASQVEVRITIRRNRFTMDADDGLASNIGLVRSEVNAEGFSCNFLVPRCAWCSFRHKLGHITVVMGLVALGGLAGLVSGEILGGMSEITEAPISPTATLRTETVYPGRAAFLGGVGLFVGGGMGLATGLILSFLAKAGMASIDTNERYQKVQALLERE